MSCFLVPLAIFQDFRLLGRNVLDRKRRVFVSRGKVLKRRASEVKRGEAVKGIKMGLNCKDFDTSYVLFRPLSLNAERRISPSTLLNHF